MLTVNLNGGFCGAQRVGRNANVSASILRLEIVNDESHAGLVAGRGRSSFAIDAVLGAIENPDIEMMVGWWYFGDYWPGQDSVVFLVAPFDPVVDAGRMRFDGTRQPDIVTNQGTDYVHGGRH